MNPDIRRKAELLTAELTKQGKLVEGGFEGLMLLAFPQGCSAAQRRELRNFFFAGAHHLFQSIMCLMDEDREPTPNDLANMSRIMEELNEFQKNMGYDLPTEGNA